MEVQTEVRHVDLSTDLSANLLTTHPGGFPEVEARLREKAAPILRRRVDRPEPEWVRGECPDCGEELVSNLYYTGGRGYLMVWECWASLGQEPNCTYRKVL